MMHGRGMGAELRHRLDRIDRPTARRKAGGHTPASGADIQRAPRRPGKPDAVRIVAVLDGRQGAASALEDRP